MDGIKWQKCELHLQVTLEDPFWLFALYEPSFGRIREEKAIK